MARYFKRRWDECRGDEYDSWGCSVYYFEVDEQLVPVKQMEIYENGNILKYDRAHIEDQYGDLSQCPLELQGEEGFEPFEITGEEFVRAWGAAKQFNQSPVSQ
jgi:hypothetical protein